MWNLNEDVWKVITNPIPWLKLPVEFSAIMQAPWNESLE